MKVEIGQIISQIISFLIMVWVLKRYAWKPLIKIMDDRNAKIASEFRTIDEQAKEVENLKKTYQDKLNDIDIEAQKRINIAIQEANILAQDIQKQAQAQAKAILIKVQDELQNEVLKAKDQLKNEIVNISLAATQKVIETQLNADSQKQMTEEFVDRCALNKLNNRC